MIIFLKLTFLHIQHLKLGDLKLDLRQLRSGEDSMLTLRGIRFDNVAVAVLQRLMPTFVSLELDLRYVYWNGDAVSLECQYCCSRLRAHVALVHFL